MYIEPYTHETVFHYMYPNGVIGKTRYRWSCLSAAQWCAKNMAKPGYITFYIGPICKCTR